MGHNGEIIRSGKSWRILCMLLVVVAGTAQVAHTHADGMAHADCSLCVAAHVTVQRAKTPAPVPSVAVVTVLEAEPPSVLPIALLTFALFTRPPPAGIVPA
jgi:hypothetical protein